MRRRSFIRLLGGAAAAWPLAARAQQSAMPVIGCLQRRDARLKILQVVVAFRKGLSEMGYVEGRNLAIEYRYAQNKLDRLPELVADLVRRQVAVIATPGSDAVTSRPKQQPRLFQLSLKIGGDPVVSGLVASLNRPGGNLHGHHLIEMRSFQQSGLGSCMTCSLYAQTFCHARQSQ